MQGADRAMKSAPAQNPTTAFQRLRSINFGLPRWFPWWLYLGLRTGALPALFWLTCKAINDVR
jgi:hypothetical protein